MAERDAFGALLLSLRDAPGLLPRLQRIAGSLGVLKRLGPRQRTVLLRMAGLGGAEPLLEHLIAGDAQTRRAFDRLLDDFEQRPEKLSEVVRGLLDPVQRPEAAAALVRALEQAVEEEEEEAGTTAEPDQEPVRDEDETADEGAETPEEVGASPAGPEAAAPPAPAEPEPASPSPPPVPPPAPRESAPPVVPAVATAAALRPLPGEPEPPRRQPRPEEVRPTTPPTVETTAEEARAPEAPEDRLSADHPPREEEAPSALRPEPADELEPIEGWDLRSRLEEGEAVSVADLATRLRDEAPSWTHRRTLQTWIESASPFELTSSLDRILQLIRTLDATPDRMWCLTSLAGSRPWDDGPWQRILAAAETPSLRRRLVHRRMPAP